MSNGCYTKGVLGGSKRFNKCVDSRMNYCTSPVLTMGRRKVIQQGDRKYPQRHARYRCLGQGYKLDHLMQRASAQVSQKFG